MSYRVDNAIIMAAGMSSRFAPLSYETPKALIPVHGEILIERQIRQIRESGIAEVVLVVGYRKEQFSYLRDKFGVILVENPEYGTRNNNGSIYAARAYLKNSYICSADNYFANSPFETTVDDSYYAALFAEGETGEWCLYTDERGYIRDVRTGGSHAWYMLGHTFWAEPFSGKFLEILGREYDLPETRDLLWEGIYRQHLDELFMKLRPYSNDAIYEFDSLDELRGFDPVYREKSGSAILKQIATALGCPEGKLTHLIPVKDSHGQATGVSFVCPEGNARYDYASHRLETPQKTQTLSFTATR